MLHFSKCTCSPLIVYFHAAQTNLLTSNQTRNKLVFAPYYLPKPCVGEVREQIDLNTHSRCILSHKILLCICTLTTMLPPQLYI